MIYITGDTHGDIERFEKEILPALSDFKENDYLIIAGDFGFVWDKLSESELDLISGFGINILFVDGNHENFNMLEKYPISIWKGGKIHKIRDNIIHLMRGQIYEICGKSIFTFGGAFSIDRAMRKLGVSYWLQEIPDDNDYTEAKNNLAEHNHSVDIIVTHTAPKTVIYKLGYYPNYKESELNDFLENIKDTVDFSCWAFGHWHEDKELDNGMYALYHNIITIE